MAALIASLTAVYVNMRGDSRQHAPPIAQVTAPAVALAAQGEGQAAKPHPMRFLKPGRIAVNRNGAHFGNADWRFAVEADGQSLFVFEQGDPGQGVVDAGERRKSRWRFLRVLFLRIAG